MATTSRPTAGWAVALGLLLPASGAPAAPDGAMPLTAQRIGTGLGRPVSPTDAARLDLTVFADGRGLPPGRGTAAVGLRLYDAQCASCHGPGGTGGNSGRLVGRAPLLKSPWQEKTIGQFWPYATTLFDYIRRAMPIGAPGSLGADEVYALTAYLLEANGLIAPDEQMNAKTLPAVKMPNRDGFTREPDLPTD